MRLLSRDWRPPSNGLIVASVGLVAAALLVAHAWQYRTFFADDSFISLRYAKRFLAGDGLTFTDGERVEGYTNFLWVMLVAAGGLLSRDLVEVARVIGLVTACVATLSVLAAHRPRQWSAVPAAAAAPLGLVLSGPVATWAVGGLETPLLCALLMIGLVAAFRIAEDEPAPRAYFIVAGSAWALAALTRPDGLVVPMAALGGLISASRLRRRVLVDAARLAALPLGVALLHTLFRKVYYDDWVPNTYHAKVAFSMHRVRDGLTYVASSQQTLLALVPPLLLTALAAFKDQRRRRRIIIGSVCAVTWLAYVICIGGDIMRHYRHIVPVLFLIALLDAEGFTWLAERGTRGAAIAAVYSFAFVAFVLQQQTRDPGRVETLNERWEWSGRRAGVFLRRAFADRDPLLAVDAAGATPYYSELDTLDMLGLNDRYLATHPPPGFGTGWLAHELGDGAYFLRRKPDLVMFVIPPGWEKPMVRGGLQMYNSAEFKRAYKLARFRLSKGGEHALIWVRKEGRIGVERSVRQVRIPGFLLSEKDGPAARFDSSGKLGLDMRDGDVGRFSGLRLPSGKFELIVEASASVVVTVRSGSRTIVEGESAAKFHVPADASRLAIEARSRAGSPVSLRAIGFVTEP